MKGNNEAFTVARYSPGIYKTEAVMFLKQCLDSDTFDRLCKSENFRRNPVVAAKIYLGGEDWNRYVWIEQHGSLAGFKAETAPDTGQKNQSAKILNFTKEENKMKQELEQYIGELSPDMQEKARQCKTMEELNALLAENEVELSDDALEAVAGGCSVSDEAYHKGDKVTRRSRALCPLCKKVLLYWDVCNDERSYSYITRMYCNNSACSGYNNGLWYAEAYFDGEIYPNARIQKY